MGKGNDKEVDGESLKNWNYNNSRQKIERIRLLGEVVKSWWCKTKTRR
jgi:hypothetical protein